MTFRESFWDIFIKKDGRVGSKTEHFLHAFLLLLFCAIIFKAVISSVPTAIVCAIVAAFVAHFTYNADKRINS